MQASEMKALRALVDEWVAVSGRFHENSMAHCERGETYDAVGMASAAGVAARCAMHLRTVLDAIEAPKAEGDKP